MCNGGYTGKPNYYEYKNDCQNNLNVRNAMAKVTIAIASVVLFLSIIVLCLKLKKQCCTEVPWRACQASRERDESFRTM